MIKANGDNDNESCFNWDSFKSDYARHQNDGRRLSNVAALLMFREMAAFCDFHNCSVLIKTHGLGRDAIYTIEPFAGLGGQSAHILIITPEWLNLVSLFNNYSNIVFKSDLFRRMALVLSDIESLALDATKIRKALDAQKQYIQMIGSLG